MSKLNNEIIVKLEQLSRDLKEILRLLIQIELYDDEQ